MKREGQVARLNAIKRRLVRSNQAKPRLLDFDAEPGTYEIDRREHRQVFYGRDLGPDSIFPLRWEVERAGRVAHVRATQELVDLPHLRATAQNLVDFGLNVARFSRRLGDDDAAIAAADLAPSFRSAFGLSDDTPIPALLRLIESLREVAETATHLRQRFDVIGSAAANTDPLARHYVGLMWRGYEFRAGHAPPGGRSGPFVSLLAAGWRDLGFGFAEPDSDPEAMLGQRVELHAKGLRNSEPKKVD